jgi:hypothetical protein
LRRDVGVAAAKVAGIAIGFVAAPTLKGCSSLGNIIRGPVFLQAGSRSNVMMRIIVIASELLVAANAFAEPPSDTDYALAPWFQSLRQPGTGKSCCSIADCRTTDYRTDGDHYEALIDGRWMIVPSEKILQRADNPTGRAVVCWTPALGIMCFVRAAEI